jgi:hypothetical protein
MQFDLQTPNGPSRGRIRVCADFTEPAFETFCADARLAFYVPRGLLRVTVEGHLAVLRSMSGEGVSHLDQLQLHLRAFREISALVDHEMAVPDAGFQRLQPASSPRFVPFAQRALDARSLSTSAT